MDYFLDMPEKYSEYKNSEYVILPVPYDGTSTFVKGADKGPQAIIDASDSIELYDVEEGIEAYRAGIYTAEPVLEYESPDSMVKSVKERTKTYIYDGKMSIVLGGEHSVSVGSVYAYLEKYNDLSVLQLDAHADMRENYHNSKFNHACVMKRIKEVCPVVQVGIRSVCIEEKDELDTKSTVYAHQLEKEKKWMERACRHLTDTVYITIDLDVFDPSVLPSTGTPFPGGMKWNQVIEFLDYVIKHKDVVGFDVVELCPNFKEKSSDVLASVLVYKIISKIVKKRIECGL